MQNDNDKAPIKFFVDSQNKVTMRCPKCGTSRTIDAATLKTSVKQINITCKCGEVFRGVFEFRKCYRKAVLLPGKYKDLNKPKRGDIVIKDLSMGGIGFTCEPSQKIKPGDHLEVVFRLDDAQKSEITLQVRVRSVKGGFVGTERTDKQLYQGALGFYLM